MLVLRVAVAQRARQAVQKLAFFVGGAREIERALIAVEAARLQHHFVDGFGGGALAGHVDQAAGGALTVQPRRRAFQDFDAFQPVGVDARLRIAARAEGQQQPVQIARRRETAHGQPVIAHVAVAVLREDARGIAHGLRHRGDAALVHFIAGDDVDRLGRVDQLGVRLGARAAARGHVVRAGSGRRVARALHHDGRQRGDAVTAALGRRGGLRQGRGGGGRR